MFENIKNTINEYPRQFWLIIVARFVDAVGGFLIFPFFSLYFTEKFDVNLVQVGFIYMIWAITGIFGQMLGGVMTDRFGRKRIIIIGLIFSALTSLALALVNRFELVYIAIAIGGLFSSISSPAYQSITPDLLKKEQITEGYSIGRVSANVAFAIGPAIGGLLASVSYSLLFLIDSVTSILTAIIIAKYLIEPQSAEAAKNNAMKSFAQNIQGYLLILKDKTLMLLFLMAAIVVPVYWQWYFSVPVFMRDVHSLPTYYYGSMMSVAGILVIIFQIPLTRKLKRIAPLKVMSLGSLFFALGFGMFGFVQGFGLFMLAFGLITFGEMVIFPTQNALIAKLAPEEMRGRYMAASGVAFSLPNLFGPALGGYLLVNFDPNFIWYVGGAMCIAGAILYLMFNFNLKEGSPLAEG